MAIGNKLREGVSAFLLWALNNSIRRNAYFLMYHQDLRNAVKGMRPPVPPSHAQLLTHAEIHQIYADRTLSHGANHQTLDGDGHGDEADTVNEMDSRAVDTVVRVLGLPCLDNPAEIALTDVFDEHITAARSGDDAVRKFWGALKARSGVGAAHT
ncbi:hypothetical protein V8E53_006052 [Lactarius tabidus]